MILSIKMNKVLITGAHGQDGIILSKILLKKRAIACSNIFPIESLYHWKGKLVHEKEHVMILKTKNNKFDDVKKIIKKNHSYTIPCICSWKEEANEEYENWLNREVK